MFTQCRLGEPDGTDVGGGGTETPIIPQGRTYLYVVHRRTRQHCYYCWETDTFTVDDRAPWQPH